jgi:hypothetical protein
MKLNEDKVFIERGGDMIESAFGISEKDSVHIINILRDKLYSNKVLAVVREYSTNAQDAHADAGKKTLPIRVTIPTGLDPVFRVRDFGDGLSEEDIREIYVLYGASTKRNSNEVVGQLGLGCKSSFAYTDKFTIVSWQNNVRKTYIAYIDETKVGKVALVDTAEDFEPNGIEIQVPVKTGDFWRFKEESEKLLPFFIPQPELIGGTIVPKKYDIQNTTKEGVFFGTSFNTPSYSGSVNVVMGGIPYKITSSDISMSDYLSPIFYAVLDIYVNIGDLDIAANRESLEFTEKTISNLKNHIKEIYHILKEDIKKYFDEFTSFRQANEYYYLLNKNYFWQKLISGITHKGKTLTGKVFANGLTGTIFADGRSLNTCHVLTSYRYRKSFKWYTTREIDASGNFVFVSIDDFDNWEEKLSRYIKKNEVDAKCYVALKWENGKTATEKASFIADYSLDEYTIINVSDCIVKRTKPVRQPKNSLTPKSISHLGDIFRLKDRHNRSNDKQGASKDWDRVVSVGPEIKHYVELDKFKASFPLRELYTTELDQVLRYYREIGGVIDDTEVYGVKAKKVPKLDSSWVPLVKEIKTHIKKHNTNEQLHECMTYMNLPNIVKEIFDRAEEFPDCSPAKKLAEIACETRKVYATVNQHRSSILQLFSFLKINEDDVDKSRTLEVTKYMEESSERYPLLSKINLFPNERNVYFSVAAQDILPHIIEHITLIENKKEKNI